MTVDKLLSELRKSMDRLGDLSGREDVDGDDLLRIQDHATKATDLWNELDRKLREGGALPIDWGERKETL